jgi:RND family efflux transporter MFP subunit
MNTGHDTTIAEEPEKREHGQPAHGKPAHGEPAAGEATRVAPEHHRLHAPVRSVAVWGPLLAVTAVAAIVIIGVWRHVERTHAEEQFEQANAQTVVNVTAVHPNPDLVDLVLPGSIEANQATTLYARSNGFLGQWFVDIGDRVVKGQRLAVIETPDVDQQLRTAQGQLNQAKANFEQARVTAVRWQELYEQKVVSAQDNDTQQSSYLAAAGAQSAAQATVDQLEALVGFNQIIAPFDGVITYRYLDVGALVSAGSGNAGTAIYGLAQTDPLRIYVYVPQSNAPDIRVGATAKLLVREYPGREFIATVTRTAGAIDPNSRTLLTELQIPNKEGTLYAGMYGEIEFSLHSAGPKGPIVVPANAFIFRTAGPQVVVVRGSKIHWQTIQVGRDYGTYLESLTGLQNGDQVVVNPSDELVEGMEVKTQPAPVEASTAGTGTQASHTAASPRPGGSPKGE